MSYTFLEHTADVKFRAEGDSLDSLFVSSFQALRETICGDITILEQIEKEIEIKGKDLDGLLYSFLEEFLFLLDSEDFLASNIKSIEIDKENFKLKATISGDKAENYKFTNDVKAITYNEMFVKFDEEKKKWLSQVVLDV